jgi:hypothetical protein
MNIPLATENMPAAIGWMTFSKPATTSMSDDS